MKAVLMSIQPKWCELIANGKKTVEVRKTRPKIEAPFKVYIYCTSVKSMPLEEYVKIHQATGGRIDDWHGKVIGEFVCDEIKKGTLTVSDFYDSIDIGCNETCLRASDIKAYLGMKYVEKKGDYTFYGWHISNLIIYDEPKELSEFRLYNVRAYYDEELKLPMPTHEIKRPPQSWCYVEEKEGADND